MKLNNYPEIVNEMVKMMIEFDRECNKYQTDVYLYVDENGNGTLEQFVNVGGNSWLNDDHITVWRDQEHCDDLVDTFGDAEGLCEYVGITIEEARKEAMAKYDVEEDEADDWIYAVIRANHYETLKENFDWYDESEYAQAAETALEQAGIEEA